MITMMHRLFTAFLGLSLIFSYGLDAVVLTVNSNLDTQPNTGGSGVGTTGDLRFVLNAVNQAPNTYQVVFNLPAGSETITPQAMLPILNQNSSNNLLIDGKNTLGSGVNVTLNGNGTQRGFIAQQGPITIQNMTIQNTSATGGNGGVGGGGGGLGAGGALFVNQAQVVLSNVNMTNNVARGGNGEVLNAATGGGGGMGGNGGSLNKAGGGGLGGNGGSDPLGSNPAGGGGIAPGGTGGSLGSAGEAGGGFGAGAAGNAADGTAGGIRGGGGGSGSTAIFNGGGGGVDGADGTLATGGNGGYGGGGAGHFGDGGFGGGGGSHGDGGFGGGGGTDGDGGFGGGGGGSTTTPGAGGVGAGNGTSVGGGPGAGFGGAIFNNSSNEFGGGGGKTTIGGDSLIQLNSAVGGQGATSTAVDGASAGDAIFATSGQPLTFNPGASQTVTVIGSIGDDSANSLPGNGTTPGNGEGVSVIKQGEGTLALFGDNTFAKEVHLQGGTTQIDRDTSLGKRDVTLNVDLPSTLEIVNPLDTNRPILLNNNLTINTDGNLVELRGRISGVGGITKENTGTANLRGPKDFTGLVNVQGGELGFFNSDSRIVQNNFIIGADGTLNLEQAGFTTGTYTGTISGDGVLAINKREGFGTVRLTGNNNAFFGTTQVFHGFLSLEGTLGGNILVFGPGVLTGHGRALGNVKIKDRGTIAPGLGTFTIDGDFTQEAGSIFLASISRAEHSLINVGGQAILEPESNLDLLLGDCPLLNTDIEILSANGGVNGQHTHVTILNNDTLLVTETNDGNHLFVSFKKDFLGIVETPNQKLIADRLQALGLNLPPSLQEAIQAFCPLDRNETRDVLDQLSGVQFTNAILAAEISNRQFTRRIFDPLRPLIVANPCAPYVYCTYKPTFDLWASATGGASFFHGTKNAGGFRIADFAFTMGAQYKLYRRLTVGSAIAFVKDWISFHGGGHAKNNGTLIGFYTLYRPRCFYVFGTLNFGHNSNRIKRTIDIGSLHFNPKSSLRVSQVAVYVELGIDVPLYAVLLQPFFALETGALRFSNFSEHTGTPFDLRVRGKGVRTSASRLGVHITSASLYGLSMALDLSWNYRFSSQRLFLSERFLEFGDSFRIKGFALNRNSFEANLFFSQQFNKCWTLFFESNALGWQNSFSYTFTGGVIFTF